MMLSQTADYALRAVLELASAPAAHTTPVAHLARRLGIPQNYLSKILNTLAREGVLASVRGRRGGFRLAEPAETITVARVVGAFEPMDDATPCFFSHRQCGDAGPCAAHHRWQGIARQLQDFFRNTTVRDLVPPGNGDRAGAPRPPLALVAGGR